MIYCRHLTVLNRAVTLRYCTVEQCMSLVQRMNAGLRSVCYSNKPLAAGCTESAAETEGGSAGAETREQAQPSPAGGPPPPLQSPSSLHVIPSPEANQ